MARTADDLRDDVRLIIAEEAKQGGLLPCAAQGKRIERLEKFAYAFMGGVAVLSFLGSAFGRWLLQ